MTRRQKSFQVGEEQVQKSTMGEKQLGGCDGRKEANDVTGVRRDEGTLKKEMGQSTRGLEPVFNKLRLKIIFKTLEGFKRENSIIQFAFQKDSLARVCTRNQRSKVKSGNQ